MASVVIILTHSLYSQIPLPVLFFRSVYSDNSLGLLSLILLIFNTFVFLINIFIPYSFETVFYLFIIAGRPLWLLAIIACPLDPSSPQPFLSLLDNVAFSDLVDTFATTKNWKCIQNYSSN